MDSKEYSITRKCKRCGNIDVFPLSKREAAFDLYNRYSLWYSECSNCNSTQCASLGRSYVYLDESLLREWAYSEALRVNEQDEEVILGDETISDVNALFDLLDDHSVLFTKKKIIIEALCVVLHDYLTGDGLEVSNTLAARVRAELIKRKPMVVDSEDWIMDYVKQAAFPYLGL
ncbi:hypothetical protein MUN82_03195 [Hymenobacter aerilatus]|uniref:Uncharacterized protein n=1 Tax=Hymenobacter aerilatus TaxID=2932251 RepID=A0A8T9T0T1_9BACT|nr:hypothetical protein [Hymenobacter aerilatus]UOR06110.1 hypothetical protein MUN82_03195 [Hymenobacter aerilatus]